MRFDPEDILEARADAEELMVDSCTVVRPSKKKVTDPTTGKVTAPAQSIYPGPGGDGRCRAKQGGTQSTSTTSGEHRFSAQGAEIHFPFDAGPMQVGDVVTITSSRFTPSLVGKVLTVQETMTHSLASAYRVRVKELTG